MSFEEFIGGAVDDDFIDEVAAFDGVDDVLPFGGFTEDGVLTVEVRGGAMSDEELGAVGVWAGVGHGEHAWLVVTTMSLALALELITWASGAAAAGATALNHEVRDDTVEGQSIIIPA